MGPAGPAGSGGLGDIKIVFQTSATDNQPVKTIDVPCPEGYRLTGGGSSINHNGPPNTLVFMQNSYPLSATVWQSRAVWKDLCNCLDLQWSVTSWAICAR